MYLAGLSGVAIKRLPFSSTAGRTTGRRPSGTFGNTRARSVGRQRSMSKTAGSTSAIYCTHRIKGRQPFERITSHHQSADRFNFKRLKERTLFRSKTRKRLFSDSHSISFRFSGLSTWRSIFLIAAYAFTPEEFS